MLDTSIQVKTDRFDGPLSLLLFLIKKEEINIQNLNLTSITEQYLNYLSEMRELNFNIAGNYLYLAATLVFLKSKTAISWNEVSLIEEDFEEDHTFGIQDHEELIRRLEELAHFQEMGKKLWELPKLGENVFSRPKVNRKDLVESFLLSISLEKLITAMMTVIEREKRQYTIVKRDRLTIKEKLSFLKNILKQGMETNFKSLLGEQTRKTLDNIVVTFISLLELARLRKITLFQEEDCGDITVRVNESLKDFDINNISILGLSNIHGNREQLPHLIPLQ